MASTDNQFTAKWIPPILAYCSASIAMTLLNKFVLSSTFKYKAPFLMLGVQSLSTVLLLEMFTVVGLTAKHRPLSLVDTKRWFPVALLMAVMLFTGSKAIQFLSVPIFTIFKNLSIILVAFGETRTFGGRVTPLMMTSFLLMVLSSVIAARVDLDSAKSASAKQDSLAGYMWMTANCISSAVFVIFMRFTIRRNVPGGAPFRDFDTVFYNNLLTIPIFVLMSAIGADGDVHQFLDYYSSQGNASERNALLYGLAFSGVCAFWISYASSWCMRVTNSTTYSMVGALNKLPIAISGLLFFRDVEVSVGSVGSIVLGFVSGLLYTIAKLRYDHEQRKSAAQINPVLPIAASSISTSSRSANLLPTFDMESPKKIG